MNFDGSIMTYTGRLFNPLDPNIENINLLDICHALGNQCRFTGHTRSFYSVAEHSCRVHDILPPELKLAGILHDASEAYLMDLARPVKEQDAMKLFRVAEDKIMELIAQKYNFEFPFDKQIKEADKILLVTEYRDLMPPESSSDYKTNIVNGTVPLERRINPWSPAKACSEMMWRLEKLGMIVGR